jgi:hypothetical protein
MAVEEKVISAFYFAFDWAISEEFSLGISLLENQMQHEGLIQIRQSN